MSAAGPARAVKERMVENLVRTQARLGEDLAGASARIAPKDEGTLRGSVAVTLIVNGTRFEGAGYLEAATAAALAAVRLGEVAIEVEVSFNTIYAARQHEELTWHHSDGQARYLSTPFNERVGRYIRLIELAAKAAERGVSI